MSKLVWGPGAMLAPVPPVMVTCGSMEHPNVLTIGWTGILNTIPSTTYISVRPERFSFPLIKESGEFVINLTTRELVRAADFCGVRSGKDLDKFVCCGLTPEPATQVSAPMLAQSPVNIECRVKQEIPLGSHHMFIAEIVAVNIDEKLIDRQGRLRLDQCGLAAYAHGAYYALGEKLGTFGFSVAKKKKKRPAKAGKPPAGRTSENKK